MPDPGLEIEDAMNTRQFIYLLFVAELILSGFWYTGTAVTALFLIAAGVAGFRHVLAVQSCRIYALSKLLLLYLLWLFIVAWLSPVPENAMLNLAILAGLPVMYLFATNMPVFMQTWQYLRTGLFIMGVMLALWAIGQVFYQQGSGLAEGPLQDRNLFAALMNLIWFLAAHVFLSATNTRFHLRHLVTGIGLFVISAALFATTSRGAIAVWLLLLPALLWAAYRQHPSWYRIVLLALIVVSAYLFCIFVLDVSIADRIFALNQDPSAAARLLLWQSSINMLLAHPFSGTGWGSFINYYPAYRLPQEYTTAGMFAHNDYLQLAVEGGIPALALQLCILGGLLIQLERKLKSKTDDRAFESLALLLGVLALFIHALVNFIFYQAAMNVLIGLYLARAVQLTEQEDTLPLFKLDKINPFFKRLLVTALLVLITLPYAAHLLGMAINHQDNLKIEHLVSDQFSAYRLAEMITVIQQHERVSQETLLQTAERALEDKAFIQKMGNDYYRQLLDSTLQRFDALRAINANDADIGVRQADLLIRHRAAFENESAYSQAHQVLQDNLKANPYHVDSVILLSRLQRLQGRTEAASNTMNLARTHILRQPDKQLLYIEWLRQSAAPEVVPDLDTLEQELRRVLQHARIARPLLLPESYYEDVDRRLDAISRHP